MSAPPNQAQPLDGVTLLTARQVADLLGVHVRSVWRMSHAGQVPPPIRLAERVVRWRLADLQEHLDGIASGGKAVRR
jgi:predicted DNA-binding transcriptional regulator AlpA